MPCVTAGYNKINTYTFLNVPFFTHDSRKCKIIIQKMTFIPEGVKFLIANLYGEK